MKLDEMNLDELHVELENVRNDIQYLDEKISRKRSWRDMVLRRIRLLLRERDLNAND